MANVMWRPILVVLLFIGMMDASADEGPNYLESRWSAIHFQPQIRKASDAQCLACHREVLEDRVRPQSPAGVKAVDTLAWYQTLSSYEGKQETFHRRHLVTPLAKQVMRLRCNTCHQGHDPREQAVVPPDHKDRSFALRKTVDPKTCLLCHGQFPARPMGMTGGWTANAKTFGDNCLMCHAAIRTTRHQVNYLRAEAIEAAGAANSDVCYGCHGGRAWYRIAYPYARNAWPGMAPEVPDWAKGRPTQSETRFRSARPKSN